MEFDVVIVGAGPAGLAAAIRLRQNRQNTDRDISVCVVEKGAEVGAHILSGAVMDPRGLNELIPDWRQRGAPVTVRVKRDWMLYLTEGKARNLPIPPSLQNDGNWIISLGALTRWLAEQAEELGVEIFPGFSATEILYDTQGAVAGVATGDMGLKKDGRRGMNHQPGVELRGRYTLFAEGARGSLAKLLERRYHLRQNADPEVYALGVKEVWEVPSERHNQGLVVHTLGWPLDGQAYGGGFVYHMDERKVSVGMVVGLDYGNPYLDPFRELQKFKTHPLFDKLLRGGRRISYGARVLNEGGIQSLPTLNFPGGALLGCSAGFMDVLRMKGIHTAIKSGISAGDAAFAALIKGWGNMTAYAEGMADSWVWDDLTKARNIRPGFQWGMWQGLANAALDVRLFKGNAPWTLHHRKADRKATQRAKTVKNIQYPKPDGELTFDKSDSLAYANVHHEEDQPRHLLLRRPENAIRINLAYYAGLEANYCPAGVYEFVAKDKAKGWGTELVINASNCLHCKCCDIKDPTGNIVWVPPEGGGGPNYVNM